MYKKFYSSYWFLKNQIFSLFPIVKKKPNHAEICRVGNLEPNFQQVPLAQFFFKFSQYCCKTSIFQIQQRKVKNIFLDKNSKKSFYYRNCIGQTNFWL